jgi:NDP-sugar pyrophosphorylase family protein
MSLAVAILAGGLAKRLGDLAASTPKALVEVAGRPFAEHQIELLRRNGVTEIVLLVGHLGGMIRETIGNGSRWNIRIRYASEDSRLLGTGGSIRHALGLLGAQFLVLYGDSYLDCDYPAIERAFLSSGRDGLMTVYRNENRWDRSNVRFEAGRIMAYDKVNTMAEMHHIDYGLGALKAAAFDGFADGDAFDLAAVYQRLLAAGALAGYEVSGRFYEIGSPEGLKETRAHLSAATKPESIVPRSTQ